MASGWEDFRSSFLGSSRLVSPSVVCLPVWVSSSLPVCCRAYQSRLPAVTRPAPGLPAGECDCRTPDSALRGL